MARNLVKKSIHTKVTRQFTILLGILLFLIIVSIGVLFINNIKSNAQTLFQNKAVSVQHKIEERVNYLVDMTKLLAKNSLMVNALIDEKGKKDYLTPLANNFMEDKSVEYLNIVDFDGKVIFKTTKEVTKYGNSKYLRRALAFGETVSFIQKDSYDLVVISPIKYYATTQGALIARFNFKNIVKKYTIVTPSEYLNIRYKDKIVYSKNYKKENKYYSFRQTIDKGSLFEKLDLIVEIGQLESVYLTPVKKAILILIGISLVLLVIGLIVSRYLVQRITKPILDLYNKVKNESYEKNYIPLGTDDELEELSKAFYEKTHELYKLQEEELKKQKVLAQQSKMASMGEMIANIAHQWRQPLSVISTVATGMKLKEEYSMPTPKEEILKNYDVINENAQYLSRTIDDFKNFLKGERVRKAFSLSSEIKSVLTLVEGSIKSNDIEIVLDLDDDIRLDGYPNELSQCLINIFNNAKDAFKDKKVEDRYFFISTKVINNAVLLKLKDNAGGIPSDILPKVFDPYFTTKHPSKGTGLGLSMTYSIITDGMHGKIDVVNTRYKYKDQEYDGAEFQIRLDNKL